LPSAIIASGNYSYGNSDIPEGESAGGQIVWKETPPISKTVRNSSEREYGSGVVLCKSAKIQAESR